MTAIICTGAGDCLAERHIHGCFADLDFRRCDSPREHARSHPAKHVREWANGSTSTPGAPS